MKKLLIVMLLSLLPHYMKTISLIGNAAAFFPTNHIMKDIFGNVWQNYGVSFNHLQPFHNCLHPLSFFINVNYLFSRGHSVGGDQRTHIQLVPLTFGLKWIEPIHDAIELYAGVAPRYYFMKIDNDSAFVPQHTHTNGCGAYVTLGSYFYPTCNLIIDLFFDYSFMKFKAPSSTIAYEGFSTNVSGFSIGGGIGWRF